MLLYILVKGADMISLAQLSTHSGFGAIHSAILNLATRCLSSGRCFSHIIPQTDAEMRSTNTYAFGTSLVYRTMG